MVRIAQERTPVNLKVSYVAGDAASVGKTILLNDTFDVVIANYLLSECFTHPRSFASKRLPRDGLRDVTTSFSTSPLSAQTTLLQSLSWSRCLPQRVVPSCPPASSCVSTTFPPR